MTQQQQPITPPPELVQQWDKWYEDGVALQPLFYSIFQAGADQELEACCELTRDNDGYDAALALRAQRRPKPPSLKEQALVALAHILNNSSTQLGAYTIRRALEQLPDNE